MEGCFLEEANPEQGGKNGDHAPTSISCKMSFDNATLYDYDGSKITNAGADTSYIDREMATGGSGGIL